MRELNSLNIVINSWCDLETNDGVIPMPIRVHIKDIYENEDTEFYHKVDIYEKDVKIVDLEHPYAFDINTYQIEQSLDYFLSFIDSRTLFDGKTFEEYHEIKLRDIIHMGNFIKLKNEILYLINKVKFKFIVQCKELFETERELPRKYDIKDTIPEDVSSISNYTPIMTYTRADMEFASNVIFDENKGKTYSEFSFREREFRALYVHMKHKTDGFVKQYQSWGYEQSRKSDK